MIRAFLRDVWRGLSFYRRWAEEQLRQIIYRAHRPIIRGDGKPIELVCPLCKTPWPCRAVLSVLPEPPQEHRSP